MASIASLLLAACNSPTSSISDAGPPSAKAVALSESAKSPDGFWTVHYPKGFLLKTTSSPGGSGMVLNGEGERHGSVTFVSKSNMQEDLAHFVKEFHTPEADESDEKRVDAPCAGRPGVVITSTWKVNGYPFVRWRCYAIGNGRATIATYEVMASIAPEQEPMLRAIVDRIEPTP